MSCDMLIDVACAALRSIARCTFGIGKAERGSGGPGPCASDGSVPMRSPERCFAMLRAMLCAILCKCQCVIVCFMVLTFPRPCAFRCSRGQDPAPCA